MNAQVDKRLCEGCHRGWAVGKYARFCTPCQAQRRRKPCKYVWTSELDQLLTEGYRSERHGVKALLPVVRRTGWPKWAVKRRALVLGLTVQRKKESPWTEEELDILERHAWKGPDRIRLALKHAGYSRTCTSIQVKRKRCRFKGDGYSLNELASLCGVDSHKVARWTRSGDLPARRRGQARSEKQGGDAWYVAHASVVEFLKVNLAEIDLRKADRAWLQDALAEGLGPSEAVSSAGRRGGGVLDAELLESQLAMLSEAQAEERRQTLASVCDSLSDARLPAKRLGISEARYAALLSKLGEQRLDWVAGALAAAGLRLRVEQI